MSEDAEYYELNRENQARADAWFNEAHRLLQGTKRVWDAASLGLPEYRKATLEQVTAQVKREALRSQAIDEVCDRLAPPAVDYNVLTLTPEDVVFLDKLKVGV